MSRISQVHNVMLSVEEVMRQSLMRFDALLGLVLQELMQQVAEAVNVRPH